MVPVHDFMRQNRIDNHLSANNINYRENSKLLKIKDNFHDLSSKTLVMGILNITPDSFYDGGVYKTVDDCLIRIEEMIKQGADIIDIGAESTRPGSKGISTQEELDRIMPVLESAVGNFETIFSVDTTKSIVARESLKCGVSIINDISGLNFDDKIGQYVADHGASIVLMHTPGRPEVMQQLTSYHDLIDEITGHLRRSINIALSYDIDIQSIVIDPGIGFGKTAEQNLQIIRELDKLSVLNRPILIGTSRKSFIGKLLGEFPVDNRLEGTAATVAASIINGASIVRVHDVLEMSLVVKMIDKIYKSN